MITEERIKELSIRFMQGWMERNEELLKEITSANFILLSPMGGKDAKTNRTMYFQMVLKLYELLSFDYRFINFIVSDHQVISSSIMTIRITQGGVSNTDEQKYLVTDVWKNENESWKIVYRHPSHSTLIN